MPTKARQEALVACTLEEAQTLKANPTTIWMTTQECLREETLLAAPWVVVGHTKPVTLHGLAAPIAQTQAVVFARKGGRLA